MAAWRAASADAGRKGPDSRARAKRTPASDASSTLLLSGRRQRRSLPPGQKKRQEQGGRPLAPMLTCPGSRGG